MNKFSSRKIHPLLLSWQFFLQHILKIVVYNNRDLTKHPQPFFIRTGNDAQLNTLKILSSMITMKFSTLFWAAIVCGVNLPNGVHLTMESRKRKNDFLGLFLLVALS